MDFRQLLHLIRVQYCFISNDNLKNIIVQEVDERTFHSLESDHERFIASNGIHKDAKKNYNCTNSFLLKEDTAMPVLEKYIVPELHLILGFVIIFLLG